LSFDIPSVILDEFIIKYKREIIFLDDLITDNIQTIVKCVITSPPHTSLYLGIMRRFGVISTYMLWIDIL